ncbi:Dual specificity mitogen-activated protein kinase kinase 7 [Schistosoma japonicum]|nr:Dual specificity mitogen-activated protein kinase kinase 7 [Schistosoma japonicum]
MYTLVLSERHRSESPATRSKSRQQDVSANTAQHSDRYDFEFLQKEITKRSGVLLFGNKVLHAKTDDFVNEGCLGSGTCSSVYKMRHRTKSSIVMAVKQMRVSSTYEEENKRIMMDLNIITKSFDCAYIVECFGIFFSGGDVWICMEVMSTCLDKLYHDLHRPFPEKVLGKVTVSITTALDYLKRKHNVMHRDVKPSNMLLSYQGVIKLCDFGISGILKDSIARSRQPGCTGYMAPERLNNSTYDVRADIWSLGISLLELATGSFPYTGTHIEFAIMTKIISDPPPSLPHHIPFTPAFRQFVELCLTKDHTQRPKYRSLMSTGFFIRHDKEPHDVLDWLKGLPLPHLQCLDEMTTSSWDCKTPTSISSPINYLANAAEYHDSVTNLSSEISKGLSNMTLSDPSDLKNISWENISNQAEVDITLVAAPKVNTDSDGQSQCVRHSLATSNHFDGENTCSHISSSAVSEQYSADRNTHFLKMQNTVADQSPANYNNLLEGKSTKFLSQGSSGYGSAGSDSSPGSLGSDSRPPSSSQVLDMVLPNRSFNGISPMPSVQRSKPTCGYRANKTDKYLDNISENNFSGNRFPIRSIMSDSFASHPSCQVSSLHSLTSSDQWSTLSLSSRTTHIPTAQPVAENFIDNPLASLIKRFEPSSNKGAGLDTGTRREEYAPSFNDTDKRSNCYDISEVKSVYGRAICKTINKRKIGQTRSSSVGAQLQRSPAQRWLVKPLQISKNLQIDQNLSTGVHNNSTTRTCSPVVSNATSSLLNPEYETVLKKNTSPQQYHHHYYYYYYDKNVETNNQNKPSSASWMIRDMLGRNSPSYPTTSNTSSLVSSSLPTFNVSPIFLGRMYQRLNTHPVPRQSSLQFSNASNDFRYLKTESNPRCSSGMLTPRPPMASQSTYHTASKETHARCTDQSNFPHSHASHSAALRDANILTQKGKYIPKHTYRSISQPPNLRDWLSPETEL